ACVLVYAEVDGRITSVVVERGMPGFSTGQTISKLGMRASTMCELIFEGVRVPLDHVLGPEGGGIHNVMRNLEIERLALAAMSLGIAQRCLDAMTRYAPQRQSFGKPIREHGQIQRHSAKPSPRPRQSERWSTASRRRSDPTTATGLAPMRRNCSPGPRRKHVRKERAPLDVIAERKKALTGPPWLEAWHTASLWSTAPLASLALLFLSACTRSMPVTERTPPPLALRSRELPALSAVPLTRLCVTAGAIEPLGPRTATVHAAGMRAVIASDLGSAAELAFTYRGPSADVAPLGNGELRRQIGLKLRARDTCNVVYVMWHIEPTPGVFVSVKRNATASKNEECGPRGYMNLKPSAERQPPPIVTGGSHVLRADVEGATLRVRADGVVVWEGALPAEAFAFDGPAGVRSDNGTFDFELRVPDVADSAVTCSAHGVGGS
ncbi:MAG: hypothetical protein M3O50_09345, partial [Myxococcota bacterium]|nr:hypothetical protein [Myxococcota bacterium]